MERWIEFDAAYDQAVDDPPKSKGDYGICGVNMRWIMREPGQGAITFTVLTAWYLPETYRRLVMNTPYPLSEPDETFGWIIPSGRRKNEMDDDHLHILCNPTPAGIDRHVRWPTHDDEKTTAHHCRFLGRDVPCYFDGSTLQSGRIFAVLTREGSPGVWREMARYYLAWVKRLPWPEDTRVAKTLIESFQWVAEPK